MTHKNKFLVQNLIQKSRNVMIVSNNYIRFTHISSRIRLDTGMSC